MTIQFLFTSLYSMSRALNLLCFFSISAIFSVDLAKARSARRLEGEGIIGGAYAEEGQFPYQISLVRNLSSFPCGGSILTKRFVVTAAHCVINDKDNRFMIKSLNIIGGTSNRVYRTSSMVFVRVTKIYVPKEYDPTVLEHGDETTGDIAILELKNDLDIEGNPQLGIVKLPENVENKYVGKTAIISGFGMNQITLRFNQSTQTLDEVNGKKDNKLRFAEAEVMSYEDCRDIYYAVLPISETHLCAGLVQHNTRNPEGLCAGDSGGGLIYDGTIIGVASTSPKGCRENVKPAIYTRVSSYLSFINNVLNGDIDENIRTTTLDIIS